MSFPIHILLLEDSPLDAELTLAALREGDINFEFKRVDTGQAFEAELRRQCYDLVLSDHMLPQFNGIAALQMARQHCPEVPFIFVSGALGEELAIEMLKSGATDYVLKQRLGRLAPAVRRALRESHERVALAEMQASLRRSELLYRTLTEAIPGMVFRYDAAGQCAFANAAWYAYTGYTPQQTLGDGWLSAIDEADREQATRQWRRAVHTAAPVEQLYRIVNKAGAARWMLVRCVPVFEESGKAAQWIGTATDIDDQKRTQASYQQLLGQLDAIIRTMNEGLAVANTQGVILSMNPAGLRLYGMDVSQMAQHTISEMDQHFELRTLDGKPVPLEQWPMARALRGETFNDYEVIVRRTSAPPVDGRVEWIGNYAGAPIPDISGQPALGLVTFRDVSAARQVQRDLADAKAQAEAANRAKDEFLATLSHELRTPLNAILGWTQLLLSEMGGGSGAAMDADVLSGLQTIERNALAQRQLVEDLLDVSRIISGKLRLNVRPLDLRGVVTAALDAARPTAESKRLSLQLVENPAFSGSAILVDGDANRLQQVVWNLMSNAIKFTPAGGHVQVRLEPAIEGVEASAHRTSPSRQPTVQVVVKDDGQGIPSSFLPHVFERFRQADGTATRSAGGLGLGLAIVRHLVELHHGTVEAFSEGVGRGATFTVTLPMASALAAPGGGADGDRTPQATAFRGLRVLVVDDEADARALVAAVLRRHNASVTLAASAAEALATLRAGHFDVLLSDIGMSGEDGFGLIRKVRQLPADEGGDIPAAAITAYARNEDRARTLEAGFNAYLAKPVNANELVAMVAALRRRSPVRDAG